MASNVYRQHYADRTSKLVRRVKKQGRKEKPPELVKVKVEFMTLPAKKAQLEAEARKFGKSLSAYIDLVLNVPEVRQISS